MPCSTGRRGIRDGASSSQERPRSGEHALQDVAGGQGLLPEAGLSVALEPRGEALGVVGDSFDAEGLRVASPKDGGRDGLLVDIESDPEDYRANKHGLVSFRLQPKAACDSGVAPSKPAR